MYVFFGLRVVRGSGVGPWRGRCWGGCEGVNEFEFVCVWVTVCVCWGGGVSLCVFLCGRVVRGCALEGVLD